MRAQNQLDCRLSRSRLVCGWGRPRSGCVPWKRIGPANRGAWQGPWAEFSDKERATFRLVRVSTVAPMTVADSDFVPLRKAYSDAQVAELVHRICEAAYINRVTEAGRLPLEKWRCCYSVARRGAGVDCPLAPLSPCVLTGERAGVRGVRRFEGALLRRRNWTRPLQRATPSAPRPLSPCEYTHGGRGELGVSLLTVKSTSAPRLKIRPGLTCVLPSA